MYGNKSNKNNHHMFITEQTFILFLNKHIENFHFKEKKKKKTTHTTKKWQIKIFTVRQYKCSLCALVVSFRHFILSFFGIQMKRQFVEFILDSKFCLFNELQIHFDLNRMHTCILSVCFVLFYFIFGINGFSHEVIVMRKM